MNFKIDTTLNIEGIIAALAILGAAISYIINLIKNWRTAYKEKRYRGTNFVILELLETNFKEGLSEDKLWDLYNDGSTLQKRKYFNAFSPSKLKRIGFEGQLKHLQSRFLIRLTGPGHYHIDFSEPRDWRRFSQRLSFQKIIDSVKSKLTSEELSAIFVKNVNNDTLGAYRRKDTLNYLLETGNTDAINKLIEDLKSSDSEKSKSATELFLEIYSETR
jgi:hypothetical protein